MLSGAGLTVPQPNRKQKTTLRRHASYSSVTAPVISMPCHARLRHCLQAPGCQAAARQLPTVVPAAGCISVGKHLACLQRATGTQTRRRVAVVALLIISEEPQGASERGVRFMGAQQHGHGSGPVDMWSRHALRRHALSAHVRL